MGPEGPEPHAPIPIPAAAHTHTAAAAAAAGTVMTPLDASPAASSGVVTANGHAGTLSEPASSPGSSVVFHHNAAAAAARDDEQHDEAQPGIPDPKRSRACEACRGLKVRCEPDPDEGEPCKRCRKAGRPCTVTAPRRKRHKRTDSRVVDLERKIDALTATLQARGASGATQPAPTPGLLGGGEPSPAPAAHPGPRKRRAPDDDAEPYLEGEYERADGLPGWARSGRGDIVDRGILSAEKAEELLRRYTEEMAPHLPAVVLPPGTTADELRRARPVLFLSIMSAASGELWTLQSRIQKELMATFAEKVFLVGEKSLDLVQALLLSVSWYYPPEHFEELKFYQLVHMAAVMAIDIGLGRDTPPRRGPLTGSLQNLQSRYRRDQSDATTLESRRTWLACYYMSCNTALSLHRPILLRWTAFMDESVAVLSSPDTPGTAPTDRYFCQLVLQHKLGEDVSGQLSLEDPAHVVDVNEPRTLFSLRALERDLATYWKNVPRDLYARENSSLTPSPPCFSL